MVAEDSSVQADSKEHYQPEDVDDSRTARSHYNNFLHHEDFYPTELVEHLKELTTTAHINHYGVLNVYGAPAYVTNVSTTMEFTETLKEFRTLLGDDREKHKVVVGVGYYFYNDSDSWDNLARTVDSIVAELFYIELLLCLRRDTGGGAGYMSRTPSNSPGSSPQRLPLVETPVHRASRRLLGLSPEFGPWTENMTAPGSSCPTMTSPSTTQEAAYRFAKAGFGKPSVLIAFALQMGVVYYTLHQEYDLPISALYQGCNGFGACQADTTELTFERTIIGLIPPEVVQMFGGRRLFQSHDTLDLMEMKVKYSRGATSFSGACHAEAATLVETLNQGVCSSEGGRVI
ncbi:hypothetical protein HPB51_013167 [Rhipicephalus microplus]|uniref:Uncharacterized protein n=1 Tax=Rhipicephalus microplus TaxID=6941 RepID=A0A9J6E262_RHIMP|nr:hypothetical protein HPB51_013167 [Rhipicephalus microplus]